MINGKKILAITLARSGSERISKKNISLINGIHLIQYTSSAVKKSQYIDKYVISTDDDEIGFISDNLCDHVIYRPKELATTTAKSSDALIHAVEVMGHDFDYIVEAMVTNPLKTHEDIDGCVEIISKTGADSVDSVVRIWDHQP